MPRPRRARKAVNYEEPEIISTERDSDDDFVVNEKKIKADSSCYSSQDDLPLKALVKKASKKVNHKEEKPDTCIDIKINSNSSLSGICRPNLSEGEESSESDGDDNESSELRKLSGKVESQPLAIVDPNNNKMDMEESTEPEEERLSQSPPTSPRGTDFTRLVDNEKKKVDEMDIIGDDLLDDQGFAVENVAGCNVAGCNDAMDVEPVEKGADDKKPSLSSKLSAKQKRALSVKEEENASSENEDVEVTKVVQVKRRKRRKKEQDNDKENNQCGEHENISIKEEPVELEESNKNRKSLRLRKRKLPEKEGKTQAQKTLEKMFDSSDDDVSLNDLKEAGKREKEPSGHCPSRGEPTLDDEADQSSDENDSDDNWEEVDEVKTKPKSKTKGKSKKSLKEEDESMAEDKEGSVGAIKDLEVSVKVKNIHAKKSKCSRKQKLFMWARQMFHRMQKYTQIQLHKTHLLCLFARATRQNMFCNNATIAGLCLSLVPSIYLEREAARWDIIFLRKFVQWFQRDAPEVSDLTEKLKLERSHVFVAILRVLGFDCRAVFSLQPVLGKLKKADLQVIDEKKMTPAEKKVNSKSVQKSEPNKKSAPSSKISESEKTDVSVSKTGSSKKKTKAPVDTAKKTDTPAKESKTPVRKSNRTKKKQSYTDSSLNDDSDPDFNDKGKNIKTPAKNATTGKSKPKRRSVPAKPSSDTPVDDSDKCNTWTEVYMATQKQWICIELRTETINEPSKCEAGATQPLQYVIGIDNNDKVKDITCRYAEKWLTMNRKLRVDREWWAETLEPYKPPDDVINAAEDGQLNSELMRQEMPTTVSAFKDHPLFVLQRHLLKYQAIYPEGTLPVGYIGKNAKKEAVYPRDSVHTLKTHQSWIKEGRSIIPGEQPYKIVKGRKKWRERHLDIPDPVQSCFGEWQTEKYIAPPVVDGKITKNEYGNVELFKPWMLPEGAVHIPLEKAQLIARKLDIDYAQAMMGWDYHGGYMHPVFEGIVVAKEHEDKVYEAWNRAEEERELKELKKQEERVYTNWKKLIKGLMIRAKLSEKYTLEEEGKPKVKGKSNAKPKTAHGGKRKSVKTEKVKDEEEDEVKEETIEEDLGARTEASAYWPRNKQVGVFDPTTA